MNRFWIVPALALSFLALSSSVQAEDPSRLSLTGEGTVSVQPDEGYIVLGVNSKADTSAKAVSENAQVMNTLYKALEEHGLGKKDIQTVEYSVSQSYKTVKVPVEGRVGAYESESVPDGFAVSNMVRITVCELDNFGKILDAVAQNGANRVHSISFGSSEEQEALDKARVLAVEDAVRRAKTLIGPLGVRLGRVISVFESNRSGAAPLMYASMQESAVSRTPVSGGSLNFSVTVSIQWELRSGWQGEANPELNKRLEKSDAPKKHIMR